MLDDIPATILGLQPKLELELMRGILDRACPLPTIASLETLIAAVDEADKAWSEQVVRPAQTQDS